MIVSLINMLDDYLFVFQVIATFLCNSAAKNCSAFNLCYAHEVHLHQLFDGSRTNLPASVFALAEAIFFLKDLFTIGYGYAAQYL
ncbi:hypothetical protein K9H31_004215 [Salmonella enterica]|nr:hypothetical protein [Salmonella enterica]